MPEKIVKVKNKSFLRFSTEIPFTRNHYRDKDKDKAILTHTTNLLPTVVCKSITLINMRQFSQNPKIYLIITMPAIIMRPRNTSEILLKAKIDTIPRIRRQT